MNNLFHSGETILLEIPPAELLSPDFHLVIEKMRVLLAENVKFLVKTIICKERAEIFAPFAGLENFSLIDNSEEISEIINGVQKKIDQLIIFEPAGGILDTQGKIISFLPHDGLANILAEQEKASIPPDSLALLTKIGGILPNVPKVAVVSAKNFPQEMESPLGAGTMVANIADAALEKMSFGDGVIFDRVYEQYTKDGIWKPRTPEEIAELKKNHQLLKKGNLVLGGFSASPRGEGWLEISNFWSQYAGNGLGKLLGVKILESFPKIFLFCGAANEKGLEFFTKIGLKNLGQDIKNAPVPDLIKARPHSEGAHLFVYQKK